VAEQPERLEYRAYRLIWAPSEMTLKTSGLAASIDN
jgi:hypothetical protein